MNIFKAEPSLHHHFDETHPGLLDRLFSREGREKPGLNRRMFDEDFARIFHYVSRDSRKLFEISSNDELLVKRLLSNVHTRYDRNSVDRTVLELVEDIATSLIQFGSSYYYLKNDPESEDIHITSFASASVVPILGTHIQLVPRRTKRNWDQNDEEVPRELRILDKTRVLRFVMPRSFKRMLSAQRKTLAVIDAHQFGAADFQPKATHEDPNPTNYFDFSVWRDMQEHALYRSTRATGWSGRKYDSSKRSDFFDCHRLIRFRRNQLKLRDNILGQLSVELSRVGRVYNTTFSVAISTTDVLPTVRDLDELEARLTREDAGFTEVLDHCFKR